MTKDFKIRITTAVPTALTVTLLAILVSCARHESPSQKARLSPLPTLPPWASRTSKFELHNRRSPQDSMIFSDAVSGMIGPEKQWILAVPHNGGGSGGVFDLMIYGLKDNHLHAIQDLQTGGHTFRARISGHRLIVESAHFLEGDANCCARATRTTIFGTPHGYIEKLMEWWNLNRRS